MEDQSFDIRQLLYLLSPSALDYRRVSGGNNNLTPQDIASRLSRCSRGASLLARVKYVSTPTPESIEWKQFYYCFAVAAAGVKGAIEISKKRKGLVTKLINLTLQEFVLIDKNVCAWCKGQGFAEVDNKKITCGGCNGTGFVVWNDKKRAASVGVSHDEFRRDLMRVHIDMIAIIQGWETEIVDALLERGPIAKQPAPPDDGPRAA